MDVFKAAEHDVHMALYWHNAPMWLHLIVNVKVFILVSVAHYLLTSCLNYLL